MRILVTGGAGFIGSHVVDRLLGRQHQVVVLDNLTAQVHGAGAREPLNLKAHSGNASLRFIHGDVRERAVLTDALRDVDTVIHLAAVVGVGQSMYTPHVYADVNVGGQALLFELMAQDPRRFRQLVVASSMSVYGEGAYQCSEHGLVYPALRDEDQLRTGQWEVHCPACGREVQAVLTSETKPAQPASIYAITKKTQEEMALVFGRAYQIPTIALRFFNIYGSRQALSNPYTGIAAIFTGRLKNQKPPLIFEDGRQTRDFIHVHDVAEAVVRSAHSENADAVVLNISTGIRTSVQRLANSIAANLNVSIEPEIMGRYRTGDVRHCVGDPSAAEALLGWKARVDLEEGLAELLQWSDNQLARDAVEASVVELEQNGLLT